MPDTPSSSQSFPPRRARRIADDGARVGLAKVIPRRPGVSWWQGLVLAVAFAAVVTPAITAEHWLLRFGPGTIAEGQEAPFTVRAPMTGTSELGVRGGVVVVRGEIATRDRAAQSDAIAAATPGGSGLYLAFFALTTALAALFTHHVGRSTKGRLVRVQVVSLATIALLAIAVKIVLLSTALSALVVPIAVLAIVPTMALDRVVGLATGVLAALVISLQAPFDIGLALLLLVQTAAAGLVVAERPRRRWAAALTAGAVTTLCTAATYLLLTYLTSGHAPELHDPLHSTWLAAAIGPALAGLLAAPVLPLYQLLVGEITHGTLIALEDLGHPLLRQIAEKSPGTWQHSLMMANMAEIAANAIGANGRLVRVGAYFHDLGKSLQPKYFIENLDAGETSPHDRLPPEVSCDAIFAHVTEGIVTARKAGLHERIVDFMHMHHGNGVLEYFWAKCREQGNPSGLRVEDFRYPGHPPQSRETALLAICDAVEAASRTLQKPEPAAIDSLVQRIVYGKLHLGQLDESGLSMGDLRRISDSLRETIRHANHGRIEYPWQKAGQDASASVVATGTTAPRLDSLDRRPARDTTRPAVRAGESDTALAATADVKDPGRTRTEPSDATRIRAGTARNAQPSHRRSVPELAADPGVEPTVDDPGAAHTQLPRAAAEPAPDASADGADGVARIIDRPPSRVELTTLPGRAPGPLPIGDATGARMAVDAPPAAPDGDVASTRATSGGSPAAEALAAPPTSEPSPFSEPTRRGGPTKPLALGAAASPAAPRAAAAAAPAPRAPAAPAPAAPPVAPLAGPIDPAQVAAALDSLVRRVAQAPFGKPADGASPGAHLDAAVTQPSAPRVHVSDLDAAVTQPGLATARDPVERAEAAVTRHVLPTTSGPAAHPAPASIRASTSPPLRTGGLVAAGSGPLPTHRGDDAITLRRPPADPGSAAALGTLNDDGRVTLPLARTAPSPGTARALAHIHDPDAGVTEPSIPVLAVGDQRQIDMPLPPEPEPAPAPASEPPDGRAGWASGLAARVDAALDSDSWTKETPVAGPTSAEIRMLLGQADPTRRQPLEEINRLQRRAVELAAGESQPAPQPRRSPHPTSEVDPDDIEAAIEVAPPARRQVHPNAIGAIKPRKPE
jgi:hypothetical protein